MTDRTRSPSAPDGSGRNRVGILSDEHHLTCSATAVKEFLGDNPGLDWLVCDFDSFNEIEKALRAGAIDLAVIPTAMKAFGVWKFTYKAAGPLGFRAAIPAFVGVALSGVEEVERVYVVPALDEFVEPAGYRDARVIHTESNADSVERLLEDDDPARAVAITNTTVAEHFQVRVLAELKEPSEMYFEVFGPETIKSVLTDPNLPEYDGEGQADAPAA